MPKTKNNPNNNPFYFDLSTYCGRFQKITITFKKVKLGANSTAKYLERIKMGLTGFNQWLNRQFTLDLVKLERHLGKILSL